MSPAAAWRRLASFFDNPDPLVALGGTVAMAVVGNQPFYPFTVAYAAGAWVTPAFATWLSTPVFLLAPALARRDPDRGRALLVAAAIGNTILSALALGPATGVEVFYAPCLLLAALIHPAGRRLTAVVIGALAVTGGLAVARIGSPVASLTAAQDHALALMHGVSAACVTGLMAFLALRIGRAERLTRSAASPHR